MTHILPPNQYEPPKIIRQRYMDGITSLLIQEKPKVRSVYWDVNSKRRKLYLAFPYIISILTFYAGKFNNLLLFYRSSPLNNPGEFVCYPNLPNIHPTGQVCLGRQDEVAVIRRKISHLPFHWQARKVLTYFWTSGFNSDLIEHHFLPWGSICPQIATLDAWQRNTRRDPPFILRIKWDQRRAGRASEIMETAPYL